MKKIYWVSFWAALITGCSAPTKVLDESSKVLRGNCLTLFLDSRMYQYQHVAQAPLGGRAVMAVSDSAQGQYCAWSSNRHWDVQDQMLTPSVAWEKLEAVAIARCEEVKPSSVKEPCRIFSRNNTIVWGIKKPTSLD
jgi:hypothetical protein